MVTFCPRLRPKEPVTVCHVTWRCVVLDLYTVPNVDPQASQIQKAPEFCRYLCIYLSSCRNLYSLCLHQDEWMQLSVFRDSNSWSFFPIGKLILILALLPETVYLRAVVYIVSYFFNAITHLTLCFCLFNMQLQCKVVLALCYWKSTKIFSVLVVLITLQCKYVTKNCLPKARKAFRSRKCWIFL